jgi:hypothetical protein
MRTPLFLLELNEVNFEFLEAYIARGDLPNFAALFKTHGFVRTTSETRYEHLEPWIQWVTAHTGLTFAEHSVFRLGDIVERDIPQIWEILEAQGLKVGAISPMNAKHRLSKPAFFVPDPWTPTQISAPWTLRRLHAALSQAVNDNADFKLTASSALDLILGAARYARPINYRKYVQLALHSRTCHWRKAMFLDVLLADVFVREVRRTEPDFSSLFLNAAAHIQHHYMFSAAPYDGPHRNPDWYLAEGADPLFEVYDLYDRIVGQIQKSFPRARLMIATGLHQVPHREATYYWRLKDHQSFLRSIGLQFETVEPRMSRDFLVRCSDEALARTAEIKLGQVCHEDGTPLFEVDNRGKDLFVVLTYPREVMPDARFTVGAEDRGRLFERVVFVALKNGEHSGVGYFSDTGRTPTQPQHELRLADVPRLIMAAFGLQEAFDRSPAPSRAESGEQGSYGGRGHATSLTHLSGNTDGIP